MTPRIPNNIRTFTLILALTASFTAAHAVTASGDNDQAGMCARSSCGQLAPVTAKTDAAWLAKARAAYPLTTCSVSGDKLDGGDMGKPLDYIYKQNGKPDRLIRFCCKDCLKDFRKDPAKYLKMIDDAAARPKGMGDMPMK